MELLVRVVDKTSPQNPTLDALLTKRGDVIEARPDGWAWGLQELQNPAWRIARVVGLSEGTAQQLMAPQFREAPVLGGTRVTLVRRRMWGVDVALLENSGTPLRNWLRDTTRSTPIRAITLAVFTAVIVQKAALLDPQVIG
jgi:hypothetical protein